MFDLKIVKDIVARWNPETRISNNRFLLKHVNSVMEAVFLAALKRNEDRPVRVGVSLIDRYSLSGSAHYEENVVLELEQNVLLSVDTLIKLSPALDSDTTVIAAWPSDKDPGVLEIWGAIFTSHRGRNRFDTLPLPLELPLSNTLTVISKKTGSLSIYKGNELITRFSSGRFLRLTRAHYMSGLIGERFLDGIKKHPEFSHYGVEYWNIYRDFIDYLLMETGRIGHGGIVGWVSSQISDSESKHIIPKYTLKNCPDGADLIGKLCNHELAGHYNSSKGTFLHDNAEFIDRYMVECKRKIIEHAEILAQMTCVDGALLISDRLRPISFGTFFISPTWEGKIGYWKDNKEQSIPRSDFFSKYGTRHNAGINFVGQYEESIVFVVSQDGPIAGLTKKDEKTIHWWPDCVSQWLI